MKATASIRYNVQSGLLPTDDYMLDGSVMYTEWWNGEGVDVEFYDTNSKTTDKFSVHFSTIKYLAVIAELLSDFDYEDVLDLSSQFKKDSKSKNIRVQKFKDDYNEKPDMQF